MATAKKAVKKAVKKVASKAKKTANKSVKVTAPKTKKEAIKVISKMPTKKICSIAGAELKVRNTKKSGTQLAYCKNSKKRGVAVR